MDAKKARNLDFAGLSGLLWNCLDVFLVETRGIEPRTY